MRVESKNPVTGVVTGWWEDACGFVAARHLRKRYRAAISSVRRASRALEDYHEPEDTPKLVENLDREQANLGRVEVEVREGWEDGSKL